MTDYQPPYQDPNPEETPPEQIAGQPFPPPPQQEPRPQVRLQLPDSPPYVTYTLIAITVLVYLAQVGTEAIFGYDLPAAIGIKYNPLIDRGEYWRLFTPMLLHGGVLHIGFNMYALYLLGRELERFYGHMRFLMLYLLGGFTGALASYLLTPNPSLGASTATFGLLGAYGVLAYRNRRIFGSRSQQILRNVIQIGVINFLLGLSPSIDNWAHLGGALGGVALAWFGGPEFQLSGSMLELRLEDQRNLEQFLLVFLVVFGAAAAAAILLRGAV